MKKIFFTIVCSFMSFVLLISYSSFEVNAEAYSVGDIIQFGSYPQTEVKDKALVAELNALAPDWNNWTSYGYYSGTYSVGTMTQGDWMRYIDIELDTNGVDDQEKYRGVKFTQYRPNSIHNQSSSSDSYQYNNGYRINTVYWFKYEPIDWRVLDPATGLVMCESIIDCQPYSNIVYLNSNTGGWQYAYFNDSSYTNYASDYETSSIRNWLNEDFYNTAFTDSEKKKISTTTLNNDGYYTLTGIATHYKSLDSNPTNDKIFLLSYNEVRNAKFGFSYYGDDNDFTRRAEGSDYAKSQGISVIKDVPYYGNSCWLLRSPGGSSYSCCSVDYDGSSDGMLCHVYYSDYGVRPALKFYWISDVGPYEHQHDYSSAVANPTCTTTGTKTYTCTCGDTYTETIPATNHKNATTDGGKSPTTTEVGYTAGKYCPDCKTWIEGHTEIPALEEHKHSYAPTTTQEPTCWREGETTYTCTCGESYTEALAKLDHEYYPWETKKKPTCTVSGLEWSYCLICDNDFEREIPAEGHNEYEYTRRATPAEAGAYVVACDKCWVEFSSISFGRPAEYKLSNTKYTYDGKTKTPKLTIATSDGKVLKKGVDYTVELPKDRTSVGTHTYRVVFMGDYLGETKVSYQILPGKTSSVSASQSTSSIKLTWKKVTGATGYRVYQYNSSTGKYKTLKTLTGTSYTVNNLKAGTTYKFAVKAYTKADGETLWASSSKTITTATKPATPTVKATAGSGKATLSWSKVTGATGYVIYMQNEFGDYEKVGSTTKTSYTVKDLDYGETYKFCVKAYKKAGDKNVYSGYKTVKVTTLYPAVYITPSGKRYHYSKSCAGKNATKTTYAKAKQTRTPCKTCVL